MSLLEQDIAMTVNLLIQTVNLCYLRIYIDHGVRTHGIGQTLAHRAMNSSILRAQNLIS